MIKKLLTLSIIGVSFFACTEKADPQLEADSFVRIYDTNDFNSAYTPIDVQQTADGGYVVLGERKLKDTRLTGIYLLKADEHGNFVKTIEVGDSLVNPVGRLTTIDDKIYFFCMASTASTGSPTEANIASVDADLNGIQVQSVGLIYPAVASFFNDRFIVLSYNNDSKESVISEVFPNGTIGKSKGYTVGIGEGSEKAILNHYLKEGKQYPFEVGAVSSGLYYFNGFYDYTFSLVFTDIDSDDPGGVVQGQQENGGFSAITTTTPGNFAAARFNFGDNYFLPGPTTSIPTSGNSSSTDLGGYSLPELIPDSKVKILRAVINKKNILVYAGDTQTRQIGLYFYDEATGEFLGSRYLGFSNPFQLANLIQTEDEGLAVCGTTYVAGRFARICLFKLSKEEVADTI